MSRTPSKRTVLALIAACAAAMVAAFLWHAFSSSSGRAQLSASEDPPLVVSAVTVRRSSWQSSLKAFGQVRATQGIDLSAEVSGIVSEIRFNSGEDVNRGAVLLRLRSNDDDAKLAVLQASADLWEANAARDRRQFELQAVSRATLDMDDANLRSFQAQVRAQRALMAEKVVRAPFSGRVGIRLVDLGQYLVAGTPIASLQILDPIYFDFNVPEQFSGRIGHGQAVDMSVAAYPKKIFKATVLAVDNRADSSNRMISVRASLGNPDQTLLPGMFATARLADGAPRDELFIPLSSISYSPYGDYVYLITPQDHSKGLWAANLRAVRLGERQGDRVVVESGLAVGDTVVTAGQIKLRSGAAVKINNSVQPADELQPVPVDE